MQSSRGKTPPSRWEVAIVGGGPAGCATALQLVQRTPSLAGRMVLLDAAVFPRHKLCGGGVVRCADQLLGYLDVRADVPSVPIHVVRYRYGDRETIHRSPDSFRVVRREDFDHALVRAVRERGVEVREGDPVEALRRGPDAISIRTARGEHSARIVVGADGARSLVRKTLVGGEPRQRFVAIEVLTEEDAMATPEFVEHSAVFDFRDVPGGLRGYAWDFPSLVGGAAVMNRGIGGTEWHRDRPLKRALASRLRECGVARPDRVVEGAAVPLYHPASWQSAERVVLAGDAVGVDPLMGEGISIAIGTGMVAAHAVADALERGEFGFADYRQRIARSAIGSTLRRNWMAAGLFYRRLREGGPVPFPSQGLH